MTTVCDYIAGAAAAMRKYGYANGTRQAKDGSVCALGAFDQYEKNTFGRMYRGADDVRAQAVIVMAKSVDVDDLNLPDETNAASVTDLKAARLYLDKGHVPLETFRCANTVVAGYNNTHTEAEVLALFDKAAANAGMTVEEFHIVMS